MKTKLLFVVTLLLIMFSAGVSSAPIVYHVRIDTSAHSGESGTALVVGLSASEGASITFTNFSGAVFGRVRSRPPVASGDFFGDLVFQSPDRTFSGIFSQDIVFGDLFEFDVVFDPTGLVQVMNLDLAGLGMIFRDSTNAAVLSSPTREANFLGNIDTQGNFVFFDAAEVTTVDGVGFVPPQEQNTVPAPGVVALILAGLFVMRHRLIKPRLWGLPSA